MSAHLTEEEQIEALKRWWKDYGKTVVVAVALGLGGFWGWNQYQNSQVKKAQSHSIAFDQLVSSATQFNEELDEQQLSEIEQLANELTDDNSLYADFAELYLAKVAVQKDDMAAAQKHLQIVADGGSNEAVKDLANLRLARVLANVGEVDKALTILTSKPNGAYAAAYAEAKGDLLMTQNRLADAQAAYQAALAAVTNQPMRRNILQLKLDNTRGASDMPSTESDATNPHALPNPHAQEAGDA